jgi:signal transduction histidine kinase
MLQVNPSPASTTEIEQEPTNVVSHDFTSVASAPVVATRVWPTVVPGLSSELLGRVSPAVPGSFFGSNNNDQDASQDDLLPCILPLLQAAIWEAWADTLELISFDPGRCEKTVLLGDRSLQQPGMAWLDRICPLDLPEVRSFFALDESVYANRSIDYRLILATGELLWVRHWLLRRLVGDGGQARLSGLIVAVPEQKRLERECLLAGEHMRNRIGQELHDDICQDLAGLSCMMEVLAGRLAQKAPELHREFAELTADLNAAMKRTRSMAHGHFPAQLSYVSLEDALRGLARQTETRFGLVIMLDLPRRLPRHTPEQIIHLYRIVQEAVSNSIRHGRATEIRIAVSTSAKRGEFLVKDNGTGFPANISRSEGAGLHSMKYRARILGGSLDFGNHHPNGAVVQLKYQLVAGGPARLATAAPNENEYLHR